MNMLKSTMLATALLAAFPLVAQAESQFVDGAGSASADLDFQITIPRMLFLRVGASGATVDEITFAPTAANLGLGAIGGTGGDLTGGVVTAHVRGNNGDVTLTSSTAGPLSNGAGDTISYSNISATSSNAALQSPALIDAAIATTTVAASNKVVDESAQWTFSYANNAVVAPGTYGGSVANNGRVTYTASMP